MQTLKALSLFCNYALTRHLQWISMESATHIYKTDAKHTLLLRQNYVMPRLCYGSAKQVNLLCSRLNRKVQFSVFTLICVADTALFSFQFSLCNLILCRNTQRIAPCSFRLMGYTRHCPRRCDPLCSSKYVLD